MLSTIDLLERLDKLTHISLALSQEQNTQRILENVVYAAKELVEADGASLYLLHDNALHFTLVRTTSLGIQLGGIGEDPINFAPIPLFSAEGKPNLHAVAAYCAIKKETVHIADAATEKRFDLSAAHAFDQAHAYYSQSFLTVPLKNHEDEVIGVLQLINAHDRHTDAVIPFAKHDQVLVASLASLAASALTKQQLIQQLEDLFEAFVRVINLAIDEKSPHTSRHCQRVPEITMAIADAAHASNTGALKDFQLSAKERHALRIAALLHDCGKVTTPVHVIDKATKLQTLFDRIHLIEARFEILDKELEIAYLKQEITQETLVLKRQRLVADLQFLQQINIGSEFLDSGALERLDAMATQYWTDATGQKQHLLSVDEHRNLSISKGTLNPEERAIINHHIVSTIEMLEALPWPKHLQQVTEYAGGHHERMDGGGYPKGLTGAQMSIPARIMAIADVYEALTASDRPYKSAKTAEETFFIMDKMANTGHLDPDLYAILKEITIKS